ncbi:hypothetical protein J3458_001719 [Metarhizium acridum]|uniref:uncharacterized protein n=1 Tax=Metarhizium acridum TaxID=92637 RepID=UPI001C6C87AD|nr:hypothetical protein J3458_001719 [Metarhizium acridum]
MDDLRTELSESRYFCGLRANDEPACLFGRVSRTDSTSMFRNHIIDNQEDRELYIMAKREAYAVAAKKWPAWMGGYQLNRRMTLLYQDLLLGDEERAVALCALHCSATWPRVRT